MAAAPHLGAQGDLHRVRQLLHARQQAGTALIAEAQLLGGEATGLQGLEGLQSGCTCEGWWWAGGAGTSGCRQAADGDPIDYDK